MLKGILHKKLQQKGFSPIYNERCPVDKMSILSNLSKTEGKLDRLKEKLDSFDDEHLRSGDTLNHFDDKIKNKMRHFVTSKMKSLFQVN